MDRLTLFRFQKWQALALAALLGIQALAPAALAAEPVPAYPPAEERSQIVRVSLSRLAIANRMDITLDGVYSLGNKGEASMIFERGSQLTLMAKEGAMRVYYMGMSFVAGASLYLTRYQAEEGQENGIRLTGQPALYEGDLMLNVDGDVIKPILYIHVEDYLLGVVPYEMSNDFPLEALKAQAVTARTYALRKQDPSKPYDVVDTTNDQVFKGTLPGFDNATQAVKETRGLCGFYQNKLAQCFYGASNGGQTELVEHVWSGGDDYSYYAMTDDPYDLENPTSLVKSFSVKKKPGKEVVSYGLRNLLVKGLREELLKKGYDPAPESLRVDEVTALSVDTPTFKPPSRLMSQLHITLQYSGRTRTEGVVPANAGSGMPVKSSLSALDEDMEEVNLFATATKATSTPTVPTDTQSEGDGIATPAPTPVPTPEPIYGPFEPVEEPVTLTLPIFPDAKIDLALEMNPGYNNEMITVVEKKDSYVLEARRYGHGVGMSQRGAEWMAAGYHKTFMDILSFYYPGMTVKQYADVGSVPPQLDPEQMGTPGPPPTPTPRPTLMPVTQEAKDGAWYAIVAGVADDSSLNLRATPDMSGEVLMRLYKHQRLLVLERCLEEGWVKVKTDVIEGYVMERFLEKE